MHKSERQDEILAILKKNKYASVQDLGAALYASQPTIRRDLASLEAAGYVMRSHGGVILRDERIDTPVAFRSSTKTHQKMQISHAAANLIGDSRTIFIDASTTASYIAGDIQTSEKLMVVTNSLRVAEELADGAPEVWCTGGRLLRTSLAFVGNQSIRCVSDFCVDIAFFSSSALGADGVINGKEQNAVQAVLDLTDGFGCDLVIETAGTEFTTRQAIEMVHKGATIVLVGYSKSGEMTLPVSLALDKELTFKTVFRYRHIYPMAIDAVASGKINLKGVVTNIFDFDDIQNAMDKSIADKANIVKAVVKIADETRLYASEQGKERKELR